MTLTVYRPVELAVDAIRVRVPLRHDPDREAVGRVFGSLALPGPSALDLVIDLDTGRVRDWPAGRSLSIRPKVIDQGVYELLAGDEVVATRDNDYVPRCLPQEYGDYLVLRIGPDGVVSGWNPTAESVAGAFALPTGVEL